MRSWVEHNNRVKADLIPIFEFNGYELFSLIGLRLRLGGCEGTDLVNMVKGLLILEAF